MFFIKYVKLACITLCLAFTSSAFAQQPQPTPNPPPGPPVTYEARLGLKSRVFEIKYRDPDDLMSVLRLLGSSVGTMSYNTEFRTITIRDYPENLATIDDAIKRLDTPVPPAPGIEFHVHILIATNAAASGEPAQFPSELNDVVKQLQTTLNYRNYSLMTSAVLRTKEGATGISNKGVADFRLTTEGAARNSPIFYEYSARQIKIDKAGPSASSIQIGNFGFGMRIPVETTPGKLEYENVGFQAPVQLREGEKVVVGTTTMQDKGVIVVITARVTK
jgi:hypothetical protein